MFTRPIGILILSVVLSGIVIGEAIAIGITAVSAEPTARMFAVAGIGIIGAFVLLVESVREFEDAHKREAAIERRSLGVAE